MTFAQRLQWLKSDVQPIIITGAGGLLMEMRLHRQSPTMAEHRVRILNLVDLPLVVDFEARLIPALNIQYSGRASRGTASGELWTYDAMLDKRGQDMAARDEDANVSGTLAALREIAVRAGCHEDRVNGYRFSGTGKIPC